MDTKDKIIHEVKMALSLDSESPVGFIAVVFTENKNGRIIPTLIDMAYSGDGKVDNETIRQKLRELGSAIGEQVEELQKLKAKI